MSEMMNEDKGNKKKMPLGLKIAIGVLCVVLVGVIGVFAYVQHYLGKINQVELIQEVVAPVDETFEVEEERQTTVQAEEIDPEDIELHVTSDIMDNKDVMNILLIGQDARPGEGRARSDSMILVTLNKKTKDIHMTSFMRDLYVELPGDYSGNRLNAAYQFGGMHLLNKTLEENFGVKVDGNIEVNFTGFKTCIDSVGGVNINLDQGEADWLNAIGGGDDNPASAGTWNLTAGMNHMDGEQALSYARIRKLGNADYQRTERQRNVLTALFAEIKNADLKTVMNMADQIFPLLTTDMTKMDLMGVAVEGLKIGTGDIKTGRVPVDGSFKAAFVRGMDVLVPDLEMNRQYLQDELYAK